MPSLTTRAVHSTLLISLSRSTNPALEHHPLKVALVQTGVKDADVLMHDSRLNTYAVVCEEVLNIMPNALDKGKGKEKGKGKKGDKGKRKKKSNEDKRIKTQTKMFSASAGRRGDTANVNVA